MKNSFLSSWIFEMPHVEYDHPSSIFIDFRLERNEGLSKEDRVLLMQAFNKGKGLVGFSKKLGGWFVFTPDEYKPISEKESLDYPALPRDWEEYAFFD